MYLEVLYSSSAQMGVHERISRHLPEGNNSSFQINDLCAPQVDMQSQQLEKVSNLHVFYKNRQMIPVMSHIVLLICSGNKIIRGSSITNSFTYIERD